MIERGRRAAERQMTLTLEASVSSWSTVDGLEERTWTAVGTTPGKVQMSNQNGLSTTQQTIGGVERLVWRAGLHVPVDWRTDSGDEPHPEMRFTVTGVPSDVDQSLLRRVYEVAEVPAKSHATARRMDVWEVR